MNQRRIKSVWLAVLAVTAIAVVPAFGMNKHRVTINHDVQLGETKLTAGNYIVKWETHSPEATVTIQGHGDVQGTATAKVVEHDSKFDRDMVVDAPDADGIRRLVEIRFGGTNKSIVFAEL